MALFKNDFFVSRRGSVASIAQEVTAVLQAEGYSVFVQDYDIPVTADFIEKMHDGIKNSRDLIVLFTEDYEASPYTRKEFTSFKADQALSTEERRVIILRCQDAALRGLLAPLVYQDLFGIDDREERKRRIISAATGQSQALKPPPRPFVGVPPRVVTFTGRGPELDRLDEILIGGRPAAVTQATGRATQIGRVAVQGMGGVGKTSLAIEYAYRFRDLYAGVWWCPAETRIGLLTSLAGLAKDLGVAAADDADVEKAARDGLRHLAKQRATYLLIYDNVADPDEIKDLLPAAGARVLITSRFSDWRGLAEEVALDVLPPAEAVAFLESRSGRKDAAGAESLAKTLGYLPLALDQAAAILGRMPLSFVDYIAQAESLFATRPRGVEYPRSIGVTFELALVDAVRTCPSTHPLMAYIAHCAPERIPMALVEGAIEDAVELSAALLTLREVSLVKNDPFDDATPAVSVHRLVQAVARRRTKGKEEAKACVDRLRDRLSAIYPADGYENPNSWALCAQLTPHLLAQDKPTLVRAAKSTQWSGLLNRAGNFFLGRGACAEARLLFEWALAIDKNALEAGPRDTLWTRSNLARWTSRCGNPADALQLFKDLLPVVEGVLGPRDPETLRTKGSFAYWAGECGDSRQALRLFTEMLSDQEGVLGPHHRDVLRTKGGIARWTGECGDAKQALLLAQALLRDRKEVLGPDHKDTLRTRNNIAAWTVECGGPRQALRLFKALLRDRERVLGPSHPETLRTRGNIAATTGDARQALRLFKALLPDQERVLGPDHRDVLTTKNNIAALTVPCGDAKAALRLFMD